MVMDDETERPWRLRLAVVLVILALGLCAGLFVLVTGSLAAVRALARTGRPDASVALTPTPASLLEPSALPSEDLFDDATGVVNLLLVQSEGNDIQLIAPDGGAVSSLTSDASPQHSYGQPTWAPDATSVAWSELRLEDAGAGLSSALYHQRLSESIATRVDTGPFLPFYIYFDPDSLRIATLSNWEDGLALRYVDLIGDKPEVALVAQGQPLYFDWSPDGERILAHIGSDELSVYDLTGARASVGAMPGDFTAPGWLAEDQLLYAMTRQGEQRLVVTDSAGRVQQELAEFDGKVTFSASPDAQRVAYTVTRLSVPTNAFGPLSVVDIESGDTELISRAPVLAFFWSPNARSIAYLTPDDSSQDRVSASLQHEEVWLRWHVWDGVVTYPLTRFVPTDTYLLEHLRWFDQYALSMTPWAPDSSAFVFAGRAESGDSGIWVQPAEPEGTPRRVAGGVYAAWSPR